MDEASQIADKLRGEKDYASDGVAVGKAMLLAECGRVMAVTDITEIPDDQLQLVDTVCVNREDPLAPLGHRN